MFQKAIKQNIQLRMAISGASGQGKTYSALSIAKFLKKRGRIAVIDTEKQSSLKYADKFDFDVCPLDNHHPSQYIKAIEYVSQSTEHEILIIDSLSHAWFAELELVDKIAEKSSSKNSFTAWKDVRPLERDLIQAIVGANCHVIATMRTKTEWDTSSYKNGKMVPTRVGTAPIQTNGIEYEFDIVGELDASHRLTIAKSRCFELQDTDWLYPGESLAKKIRVWMGEPWLDWRTENDAILWGFNEFSQAKIECTKEAIETAYNNLNAANGKKALLWARWVIETKLTMDDQILGKLQNLSEETKKPNLIYNNNKVEVGALPTSTAGDADDF